MAEKGSIEFTRAIFKNWILKTCRSCRGLKAGDECSESSCNLQQWKNTDYKAMTWDILQITPIICERCFNECGSCFPLCQNHRTAASQCPNFQAKQCCINFPTVKNGKLDLQAQPVERRAHAGN
jgi:hypothetical protein